MILFFFQGELVRKFEDMDNFHELIHFIHRTNYPIGTFDTSEYLQKFLKSDDEDTNYMYTKKRYLLISSDEDYILTVT